MIRYAARCEGGGHEFDGWYKDSAAFDRLAKAGLIECPACGGTRVSKALMAPAVVSSRRRAAAAPEPAVAAPQPAPPDAPPPVPAPAPEARAATGPMPAQLVAMLRRMRAEVERRCDYVGPNFAAEARKMHDLAQNGGETERRGIYGEATPEEAEALRDDGIEVSSIPWVPKADG